MATAVHIEYVEPKKPLGEAFAVQSRVIGAIILREIRTRFWKNQLGYLWAFGEPCVHIAVWFAIRTILSNRHTIHDMTPMMFLATGILPYFMFRNTGGLVTDAIRSNQALLSYPLVKHVDLFVARFLLEASTMITVFIIVFTVLYLFGEGHAPDDVLALFPACGSLLLLGFGFGTFNSVCVVLSQTYSEMLSFSNRILYFSSGIFFLGNELPKEAIKWLSINPIFQGVELVRSAYSYSYKSEFASVWYVLAWASGFLMMGLIMERLFRKNLREP